MTKLILSTPLLMGFLTGTIVEANTVNSLSTIHCQMVEFKDGESIQNEFSIESDESNPHGQMYFFKSNVFAGVNGFVSLMSRAGKKFVVFNLYSESLQVGTSSQHQISETSQHVQHQMILPSTSIQLSGITITCLAN